MVAFEFAGDRAQPSESRRDPWRITSALADAPNTPATQSHKAHVVITRTRYNHVGLLRDELQELPGDFPAYPDVGFQCVFADLQRIPETCGGRETKALIREQLRNTGVRLWTERDMGTDCNDSAAGQNPMTLKHFHLEAWFIGSDQGPDQVLSHHLIEKDVESAPLTLYFRSFCFHHISHLCSRSHLKLAEFIGFKNYFGTIAKIINVWRTSTNAVKLYRAYKALEGERAALRVFQKLPRRPLRQRWGAVHTSEADLLRADEEVLPKAWRRCFSACMGQGRRGDGGGGEGEPQNAEEFGLADEELRSFSAKIGRWTRESDEGLHDASFWRTMRIAQVSRGPNAHFRCWLQKNTAAGAASASHAQRAPWVQLVCVQSTRIFDEWAALLAHGAVGLFGFFTRPRRWRADVALVWSYDRIDFTYRLRLLQASRIAIEGVPKPAGLVYL